MSRPFYLRSRFWWAAFALWFVTLFLLSSFSGPDIDAPEIPHLDKVMHLVFFTAGGLCLTLGLFFGPWRIRSGAVHFLIVLVIISAIGVFDEWHQTFTAGRQGADVFDWLADSAGGALAGAVVFFVPGRLRE